MKGKSRKFFDHLRILVFGGSGGHGLPKYGGVGGKGGDVYVVGEENYTLKRTLSKFPTRRFIGGRGFDSKYYSILGKPGIDLKVTCPLGVTVIAGKDKVLGELINEGDSVLLARGGVGGSPSNNFLGMKGEKQDISLNLKLLADVGFVGFPNAGKSTLLKALSRASPKIAAFPFTTIEPNLGIIQYPDLRTISAADLPGLIEGAHCNFGMGHKFLKHCERTKILLFVVDIDGFQLSPDYSARTAFETVMLLHRELDLFNEELMNKPALLAVNKIDNDEGETKFKELKHKLENIRESVLEMPEKLRPYCVIDFDCVVPISALNNHNIPLLKEKIRTLIDIHEEKKMNEQEPVKQETEPDIIRV